jgi:hypothetical protein
LNIDGQLTCFCRINLILHIFILLFLIVEFILQFWHPLFSLLELAVSQRKSLAQSRQTTKGLSISQARGPNDNSIITGQSWSHVKPTLCPFYTSVSFWSCRVLYTFPTYISMAKYNSLVLLSSSCMVCLACNSLWRLDCSWR